MKPLGWALCFGIGILAAAAGAGAAAQVAAGVRLSARLLTMPRAQWEERQKEIDQRLAAPDLAPAERARLLEERQAIADGMRPFAEVAATLFSSLTPDQIQQLRSGRDVRF